MLNHLLGAAYTFNAGAQAAVKITDGKKGYVFGNFSATLLPTRDSPEGSAPDSAKITEDKINHVQILY